MRNICKFSASTCDHLFRPSHIGLHPTRHPCGKALILLEEADIKKIKIDNIFSLPYGHEKLAGHTTAKSAGDASIIGRIVRKRHRKIILLHPVEKPAPKFRPWQFFACKQEKTEEAARGQSQIPCKHHSRCE